MKPLLLSLLFAGILCLSRSDAATLLLDDFSSGSFLLSFGGSTSNSGAFGTPLTDQRNVSGVGFPNWTATLATGDLDYNVNQLDPSPRRNYLNLKYSLASGTFSLLGYEAFAVDVTNVVGTGEFVAFVDGTPGADIRFTINGSSTIVSPFSGLDTSQSLGSLSQMNFRFYAISDDFSLTIDDVRIVPEPSASLLTGFGAVTVLFQRRRKKLRSGIGSR